MYPAGKVAEKEGEGRVKGKRLLSAAMLLPLLLTACGERPGECEGEMEGKRMERKENAGRNKSGPFFRGGIVYLPDHKPSGLFPVSGGSQGCRIFYCPYD